MNKKTNDTASTDEVLAHSMAALGASSLPLLIEQCKEIRANQVHPGGVDSSVPVGPEVAGVCNAAGVPMSRGKQRSR